jgi:serine protease Do
MSKNLGCALLFSLALLAPASATTPPPAPVIKAVPSVVKVMAKVSKEAPSSATLGAERAGSGVIIGPNLVLTIGYLILEAESLEVRSSDGKRIPAAVAGYDHQTGFGLLRTVVPLNAPPLILGNSDPLAERDPVFTIGQGEAEPTELVVSSRKPFAGGWEYLLEAPIYTFPAVNNWSGSALVNTRGELVGIGSLFIQDAATTQRGIAGNLFVPINLLKPVLDDLLARGRRAAAVQPWIGMSTEVLRGNLMVVRLAKDGPAQAAGIQEGDVVLQVGDTKVADQAQLYRQLFGQGSAGAWVKLRVLQKGDVREIEVKSIDRHDFLRKPSGV